jgi:hypothetical protein
LGPFARNREIQDGCCLFEISSSSSSAHQTSKLLLDAFHVISCQLSLEQWLTVAFRGHGLFSLFSFSPSAPSPSLSDSSPPLLVNPCALLHHPGRLPMILSAPTMNLHLRQPAKTSSNAWSVNLEARLWTRPMALQM